MSVQTVPNTEVGALAAASVPAGGVTTWGAGGTLTGGSYADYTGIGTPSNPPPGVLRVYTKLDNRIYTLDSTGVEAALGAGGLGLTIPLGQHLTFSPDNTYDIGTVAALRPRNVYVSGAITAAGNVIAAAAQVPSVGPASGGLALVAGGATQWVVQTGGNLISQADNTQDIGQVSTNRPRNAYFGTSVITPSVDAATVGPTAAAPLLLRANNTVRWSVAAAGTLAPAGDATTDVGTSALRVRNVVMGGYDEMTEIARPTNPAAGTVRVYPKADHHLYVLDSSGTETDLAFLGLTQANTDARYLQLTGGSLSGRLTITTIAPSLVASGGVWIDAGGVNDGVAASGMTKPALYFGAAVGTTGEGIASPRTAGSNQFGLDFFTSWVNRLQLSNSGNLTLTGGTLTVNGASQLFGTVYVGAGDTYFARNAAASILFNSNIGCAALYPASVNSALLYGCTVMNGSVLNEGVVWNGWVRMAGGGIGVHNNSYGMGIYWDGRPAPAIYGGIQHSELLQSHSRNDQLWRLATGGNVTIDFNAYDGGCFNTGSFCYLPDMNYVWGRMFFVKNMTGANFSVYVTNGNGIYTTGWVNPMTLGHGDSIMVIASQAYVGVGARVTYLPSKFPVDPPVVISNNTNIHLSQGGGGQNATPIYTDRAGRWMFYCDVSGNIRSDADNSGMNWAVRMNGGDRRGGKYMIQNFSTTGVVLGWGQYMDMGASTQWYFAMSQDYWLTGDIAIAQYLFFVPTLATPR